MIIIISSNSKNIHKKKRDCHFKDSLIYNQFKIEALISWVLRKIFVLIQIQYRLRNWS